MSRLERYQRAVDRPLAVAAIGYLVVYGVPIVWPTLPRDVDRACEVAGTALWALFALDLAARTALHQRRLHFLLTHPVDVLVVALPMLRPLRVLRIFTAAQLLLTRGGLLRSGQTIAAAAALLVITGALAVLDAERGAPGANITGIVDALWWAVSTITSVGYGDRYPVTGTGRLVAAALMFVGISLVGTITATVAAWLVAHHRTAEDQREGEQLARLVDELAALREELARQGRAGRAPDAS